MLFGKRLTPEMHGVLYMVIGLLILLYAFNFFARWLNIIVISGGFGLLAYGFWLSGGVEKVQKWSRKVKK